MKKNNGLKNVVNFLFEIGTAKNVFRNHHQLIKNSNDTIGSHSFRTAIIGLILAEMEKVNQDKVMKMCLLHDLAELRTGDANFIHKNYQTQNEEKAIQDQWKNIIGGKKIILLLKEYNQRRSKESIVAKDADILDQIFLQKEYLHQRPYDFKKWHQNMERDIKTKSALKISRLVFKTESMDWVYDFAGSLQKNTKHKTQNKKA